jgi:hypothetical protein
MLCHVARWWRLVADLLALRSRRSSAERRQRRPGARLMVVRRPISDKAGFRAQFSCSVPEPRVSCACQPRAPPARAYTPCTLLRLLAKVGHPAELPAITALTRGSAVTSGAASLRSG